MHQVFVSYVEEDADAAAEIAHGIEDVGLTAWFYHRNSTPGPSYLAQIADAIAACRVMVVVISPGSAGSEQMEAEIVRGFEMGKPFLPVLRNLSHLEFQERHPAWRGAIGAATSVRVPGEGIRAILPRIIAGLAKLGAFPVHAPGGPAAGPTIPPPRPAAPPRPPAPDCPPPTVRAELTARFDAAAYPAADDPLAYALVEWGVSVAGDRPPADGTPADLALVLDVSGSMDKPNRYPLLRDAVRRLIAGVGPDDRVGITLFSNRAETIVPFTPGADAADVVDQVIECMDRSALLFGGGTLLAPGLRLALGQFAADPRATGRVRRVYVLTDGDLHDPAECATALDGFRPQRVEVHAYGFGDGFDPVGLKRLVSDQIGGTVKPILNAADIVRTFAHVAAVNRRLVGQDGRLAVALRPDVVCGDAWVFLPAARHLGPIRDRRLEHLFGGVEAGRRYAVLVEVRLPAGGPPGPTPVGEAEAGWVQDGRPMTARVELAAPRAAAAGPAVPDVRRAFEVVDVLRRADDPAAKLASLKARRELAVLENRDPSLIAALDKMIATLTQPPAAGPAAGRVPPPPRLTEEDKLYLASDPNTDFEIPSHGPSQSDVVERDVGDDSDSDFDLDRPDT